MKRIRSHVQLRLERETLRRLGADELAQVNAASGLFLCVGPPIVPPIVIVPNQPIPGAGPDPVQSKLASGCDIFRCGTGGGFFP
jgi:hypothetical protein